MKQNNDIAFYKQQWQKRWKENDRDNERLRSQALAYAQELAAVLADQYSVKRVILFGSALEKGRFNHRSDIDLAVEGLIPYDFFHALGCLMNKSTFPIDLKLYEEAGSLLKSRIMKGKVLYEKREHT